MKHSQQRPLRLAATSEAGPRQRMSRTLQDNRFHLSRWIAVILALLFLITSCASLTPDRIQVLAQIAGQAAQLGAQEWLAKHPTHRDAFNLVIVAINNFVRKGETNMAKYTDLLASLPTMTLRGEAGELYISDVVVVYDKELRRSTRIKDGPEAKPVQESIRRGLRRALALTPPPLPKGDRLPGIVPEGAPLSPPLPRFQPAKPYKEWMFPPWVPWHTNYSNTIQPGITIPVQFNTNGFPPVAPSGIIPESPEPPPKTDAELDAEFEAIKAGFKKVK